MRFLRRLPPCIFFPPRRISVAKQVVFPAKDSSGLSPPFPPSFAFLKTPPPTPYARNRNSFVLTYFSRETPPPFKRTCSVFGVPPLLLVPSHPFPPFSPVKSIGVPRGGISLPPPFFNEALLSSYVFFPSVPFLTPEVCELFLFLKGGLSIFLQLDPHSPSCSFCDSFVRIK